MLVTGLMMHSATAQDSVYQIPGLIKEGLQVNVMGKNIYLEHGRLWAPKGYLNTKTGTKDSEMGFLKSSSLVLNYDIGFSAGAHMGDHKKSSCGSYLDTTINGHRLVIGITSGHPMLELIVTIYGAANKASPFDFPVNFWATVNSRSQIIELLAIIVSYQSKT